MQQLGESSIPVTSRLLSLNKSPHSSHASTLQSPDSLKAPWNTHTHRGHTVLGAFCLINRISSGSRSPPRCRRARSTGWRNLSLTFILITSLHQSSTFWKKEARSIAHTLKMRRSLDLLLLQVGGCFQGAERGGTLQQTKQRSHW